MATVFLASASDDRRHLVAIKVMHAHLRGDVDAIASALREARLASTIRHPNVACIEEVIDDPMGLFLVMQYVHGDSLAGLAQISVNEQPLPKPIVARIVNDMLAGLHAAHEARDETGRPMGLVHRDLSPHNLLLGSDGVVRLADFGIAKRTADETASSMAKGKLAYMSPEQSRGEKLDRRTDVWAAGVVIWELLANRRLIQANDVSKLYQTLTRGAPNLLDLGVGVSTELASIVAWALQVDREARPDNAEELRQRVVAAFDKDGGVASQHELASFVAQALKERLTDREHAIAEVLNDDAPRGFDLEHLAPATLDGSSTTLASVTQVGAGSFKKPLLAQASELAVASDSPTKPKRQRRAVFGAFAGLVAVGLLLIGGFGLGRVSASAPSSGRLSPMVRALGASALGTIKPIQPASPTFTQPLLVVASEPIASLSVAGRTIGVTQPVSTIEVALSAAERQAPLRVSARTRDGRSAAAQLDAGSSHIELKFPAPRRAAGPVRAPSTKIPPRGLHPM